ncbi:MAG: PEP-CTERM sorting domain-containing protein [Myxococcota bacterium]
MAPGTASASTFCVPGGCQAPPDSSPDRPSLEEFPFAPGIDGMILADDLSGLSLDIAGDLVIHVPGDSLTAPILDLRAVGGHVILGVAHLELHLLRACIEDCHRVDSESLGRPDVPFRLVLPSSVSGPITLYAGGNIFMTGEPVPEPRTAVLLLFGAGCLFVGRPRVSRGRAPHSP